MKLKAKPEYFKKIQAGTKLVDYRDAHITFVNTENGKKCIRDVIGVKMITRKELPDDLRNNTILFSDDVLIAYELSKEKRKLRTKGKGA